MSVDIAGGLPWINAKQSLAIIRRELAVSHCRPLAISTPIIVNMITIVIILNNENSIIISMNNFFVETFIYYTIKWLWSQIYVCVWIPMPTSSPVCCDKNIVMEIYKCDINRYANYLLFFNPLGRSRRSYLVIWKIEILEISSVICANRCKYLWGIRLNSYFFHWQFHFVFDSDFADFQGNVI